MRALAIAATGMNAQQTNLEVIANNIANINTTGFKRARAEFSDLLYQVERLQGVPNRANQALVPEGSHVGLGVKTTAIRNVHVQGALTNTGNKLRRRASRAKAGFRSKALTAKRCLRAPAPSTPMRKANWSRPTAISSPAALSFPARQSRSSSTSRASSSRASPTSWNSRTSASSRLPTFSNESGLAPTGRQPVPGNAGIGCCQCRHSRRSRLRHDRAILPGIVQRRSGEGNHRADLRTARL
jgi:flagellar basal-body rod protein FlgG